MDPDQRLPEGATQLLRRPAFDDTRKHRLGPPLDPDRQLPDGQTIARDIRSIPAGRRQLPDGRRYTVREMRLPFW